MVLWLDDLSYFSAFPRSETLPCWLRIYLFSGFSSRLASVLAFRAAKYLCTLKSLLLFLLSHISFIHLTLSRGMCFKIYEKRNQNNYEIWLQPLKANTFHLSKVLPSFFSLFVASCKPSSVTALFEQKCMLLWRFPESWIHNFVIT